MEKYKVMFQPDGIRITVEQGTFISDAMKAVGLEIQMPCDGEGTCGKCGVEIHPDAPEPNEFDFQHLTEEEIHHGMRLACKTGVNCDMSVLISPNIRVFDGKILIDGIDRTFDMSPLVSKTYIEMPEPSLEDQAADLLRIKRALNFPDDRCPDFDIDLLRELPSLIRNADYKVTIITADNRVIGVEPGNTTERLYGIAFDIGTTTVVGTVIDLLTGRELSYASQLNAQVVYGEDTISRIKHVIENHNGRRDMTEKIKSVVNKIIHEAASKAGISTNEIYEAVFVGNTTMSHLFLELDPTGLSQIPFIPVTNSSVNLRAVDAGIDINPRGNVYTLPNIAGFVGSDTVGVMLACNYLEAGPTKLAIDVGTNGELALKHDSSMTVCSTAAGPALEGASLTCGMRAANGAIEHVRITPETLEYDVIGNTTPIGLCGSGIIDMIAELLEAGIIDQNGAILVQDKLKGEIPAYLLERVIIFDGKPAFLVYKPSGSDTDFRKIVITQKDVRQIQLAKGAIRAGINIILRNAGLTPDDLDEILLAGAFGNYIKKGSAQRIGLLPDIPQERIRFVGNAASTGAKMALLSRKVRKDTERIRQETKHIELAALPDFMDEFMNTMTFP